MASDALIPPRAFFSFLAFANRSAPVIARSPNGFRPRFTGKEPGTVTAGLLPDFPLTFPTFISECCLGGIRPSAPIKRLVSSSWSLAMTERPDASLDSRVAKLLASLSAEQTKLIGEITILWNAMEHQFTRIVWLGVNTSDIEGEFITADLPNVSRIKLVQNLARHHFKSQQDNPTLTYIETVADLFDQCRVERNDIVHGLPVQKGNDDATHLEKRTARKGTGQITISRKHLSLERLAQFKTDLSSLWTGIDGCIFMFWSHHLMATGVVSKTHRAQNLERCKRIGIDQLQTILGRLHRLHST
jgi:hypothetical protein